MKVKIHKVVVAPDPTPSFPTKYSGKYILEFDTAANLNAYRNSQAYVEPFVGLVDANNSVYYNKLNLNFTDYYDDTILPESVLYNEVGSLTFNGYY